ncbi:hypothetical protein Bbelb_343800 [Branchiostoma belcheri]|nr:hypothetical protein Bbelb_343800 [Branchiostoma belcheri]
MAQVPRPPAPGAVQAAIQIQQPAPPLAATQGQPPAAQQQQGGQVAPAAQQGQVPQQQQGGVQQPLPAAQPAQGQAQQQVAAAGAAQPNPVGPAGAAQPDAPPQPPQEEDQPSALRPLHRSEMFMGDENSVWSTTDHDYIKTRGK